MGTTPGQYLKQIMKEQKITQQELANKIGLARSTVGMYVSDNALPSLETWEKIAVALNIQPEELNKAITEITINEHLSKEANAREAVIGIYGKTAWKILEKVSLMTNEGKEKLLDRANEILKIAEYDAHHQEQLKDFLSAQESQNTPD